MSATLNNAACTFLHCGGFTKYAYSYHGYTSLYTSVHFRTGSFALDGCGHTKEFSGKAVCMACEDNIAQILWT
jgi:hypothetical protein